MRRDWHSERRYGLRGRKALARASEFEMGLARVAPHGSTRPEELVQGSDARLRGGGIGFRFYPGGIGEGGGKPAPTHNMMPGKQGGTAGEYYHLTAAEYAGTWGHQLIAISGAQAPIEGVRMSAETGIGQAGVLAKAISSGDMVDGFGAGYVYAIQNGAGVENIIAAAYAVRAGADNAGALVWQTATAGTLAERMRLTATGLGVLIAPEVGALEVGGFIHPRGPVGGAVEGEQIRFGRRDALYRPHSIYTSHSSGVASNWLEFRIHDEGGTPYQGQIPVLRMTRYQVQLLLGSVTAPSLSFLGRTTDGLFSQAAGAIGVAIAGVERGRWNAAGLHVRMRTTAQGYEGVGFLLGTSMGLYSMHSANEGAKYPLRVAMASDAVTHRYWQIGWYTGDDPAAAWTTAFELDPISAIAYLAPTATALSVNGQFAQSTAFNTLVGRIGDTTTRFGGTIKNLSTALPEFESQSGLVQTMWSDTVDKDLWVSGKPFNVFAAMRLRLPQVGLEQPPYVCTVEILLGTEVICGHTLQHTWAGGENSSYYYVELRSRVTKYAGASLRNIASVKQSGQVLFGNWVEGAHLPLTEYAEGRVDPVREEVTAANVTLQVRVTFSHQAGGLSCRLMDGAWGPEAPVL